MLAEELINPATPILRPYDSVGQAVDLMDEYGIRQLALVEDEVYKGLLSEDILLSFPDDEKLLSELNLPPNPVHAGLFQHIFEVMGIANQYRLDSVPVLDEENLYAGTIVVTDMLAKFAGLLGSQEAGAVVVLKMSNRDYSMTDISRLVESNNTKIISSYFSGAEYGAVDQATLTLKLNRTEVSAVVATFERFGYTVENVYANEPLENPDRHRLDLLLRYLET
ncbi:CBS domain-containing protein [Runella slithyformis]|uniref:CBS domain containing protein n=1 Tax=Runella slithyformis (strain ATCC 29530 / DSM 19594 / LMG 11500 / NCIMB 11436 / LSU 4) TaxID=761193 RepID=A0A7U3ZK02_RUNSL|nr:CBS domain-containing protein [Runella slithyformis]AEI48636.1 CBS domain containing protein [Runella slithyformis DSM 19594]